MDSLTTRFQSPNRDKKEVENVVANHLSRLVIAHNSHESLMLLDKTSWYAHIANYLLHLITLRLPGKIAYKTILGMSPYRLVYGKAAISLWKSNIRLSGQSRRMKRWHDRLISNNEFGKDKESYSMTQSSISFWEVKSRRNCKRGERRSQGTKGAQKHANSMACENFAAKIAPLRNEASFTKLFRSPRLPSVKSRFRYEKGLSLQNYFAPKPHRKNFRTETPFGTRVPFHAKPSLSRLKPSKAFISQPKHSLNAFGTRVPFCIHSHFAR
ncbi:hypothetical protein AAG906_036955 [Vitis piasezkii]